MSSNSYSEESVIDAMDAMFDSWLYIGERDTVTYGVTESMSGLEGLIYVGFTYFYTEKQQISSDVQSWESRCILYQLLHIQRV